MFHDVKINIFACLLLVVSSAVFYQNYKSLNLFLKEQGVLIEGIQDGESQYSLMQGKSCVAHLNIKTAHEQMLGLRMLLILKDSKIEASLFFNPIGQFVGGQARFDENKDALLIEIRGVSPIAARAFGSFKGELVKKQIEIPGHLELQPTNDFTLSYPRLLEFSSTKVIQKIRNLDLSVQHKHCDNLEKFNFKVESEW